MHASAADRLLVAASATKTLPWYVEGEESKAGAGVLLFAYGRRQLNHFLLEAQDAALTFRRHNPRLKIAIVTNNATVNPEIFSRHINPRSDLLFAGDLSNGGQNRTDGWPRQWLTRLYYMAHSPFEITWALDSNVGTCTPGAAQAFLDAALQTKLWGYDVAQASQSVLVMYPHNWNIVFRWSPVVSSLMRDWFLLQLRRGVAHDDQKTLHLAVLRHQAAGMLQVAQLRANFAAAFYTVKRPDKGAAGRVTRRVVGRVHVVHTNPQGISATCAIFNANVSDRQMVRLRSAASARVVFSKEQCAALLNQSCAFRRREPAGPNGSSVFGVDAVFTPKFEELDTFRKSSRF